MEGDGEGDREGSSSSSVFSSAVTKSNKRLQMEPSENTTGVSAGVDGCTYNDPNAMGRRRSVVWELFVDVPMGADKKRRAECKRCGKRYICESSHGTSNMKKHLNNCPRNRTGDIRQLILSQTQGSLSTRSPKLDPEKFRELLIAAIIKHDLPFQFVECEGVRDIFSYLSSDLEPPPRHTVEADVLKMFEREKSNLKDLLSRVPGRICLTSDLWSSITTDTYLTLTAYFIDLDWRLNKRMLNFSLVPPPHTGVALSEKIYTLLSEWGIENKVFSFTLDNASNNDCLVHLLKCKLKSENALVMNGDVFNIRCCAHILNSIVQGALKEIGELVVNIRESIKYVRGSAARKQKFFECVSQVSLEIKKDLRGDIPTRWDSTYIMLKDALFYHNAFIRLQLSDTDYKHCPSEEEWIRVEKVLKFLGVFHSVACLFSKTRYPTANLYFPEIFIVQKTLKDAIMEGDSFMQRMASQMNAKFDKYWLEYGLIFAIAVVLDPRYKLGFVEWAYAIIYGNDTFESKHVRDTLYSLFDFYKENISHLAHSSNLASVSNMNTSGVFHVPKKRKDVLFEDFDRWKKEHHSSTATLNELQAYLDEEKLDREKNFDILAYWEASRFHYPILSHLARDVLSIPISTVASESAFNIGSRVLDQYHSSLSPETVEALLCTRDWIYDKKLDDPAADEEDDTEDIFNMHPIESGQ